MNKLSNYVCMLLIFFTQFAFAAEVRPANQSALAGHYYLEDGPSEVGSELLLKDSGEFRWGLMYGASDYMARGTWQLSGKRLTLSTRPAPEPAFRIFADHDYDGTTPAEPGRWIAVVGVLNVGPVADIEVRFEARSGKSAVAISKPNGDAIVKMPSNEVWVRTGLRRAKSDAAWQWFPVDPERARTRLVGFALTNQEAVRHAPFTALQLRVEPRGLIVEGGLDGLSGTYAKH